MSTGEKLLDMEACAAQLGVSIATLQRWRLERKPMPRVTRVGRFLRFTQADINQFIQQHKEPAAS